MTDTEAPEAPEGPERYLTFDEVQGILGIGKTRFYELVKAGEFERVDISKNATGQARPVGAKGPRPTWRVPESSLQRYIERSRVPTP
jgi:predicted DNA-binding transcriptional regulator AlpA